jgi:hypothetical protein
VGLSYLKEAQEGRPLRVVLIVVAVSGGHAPVVAVATWALSCLHWMLMEDEMDRVSRCRRHDVAAGMSVPGNRTHISYSAHDTYH